MKEFKVIILTYGHNYLTKDILSNLQASFGFTPSPKTKKYQVEYPTKKESKYQYHAVNNKI